MFRSAISKARHFTLPIILARRSVKGDVSAAIGSFVVVNRQGWILTASHMVELVTKMVSEAQQVSNHAASEALIRADTAMSAKEKKNRLRDLGQLNPNLTKNFFPWWGRNGVRLDNITGVSGLDLAVGKLEPFDPAWIQQYPLFRNPAIGGIEPGVSLCKLGYALHQVDPIYDEARNYFDLPIGNGLPQFPIEGILTRLVELQFPPGQAPNVPYPCKHIETSSPGLKGQSGGPIFDKEGTVWAIQSLTAHYPLGFDPPVPGTNGRQKEHQFINVGRGVHIESIVGLLQQVGVEFEFAP